MSGLPDGRGSFAIRPQRDGSSTGPACAPGSRFGRGGIEIDHVTKASPAGTQVLAEIPNLFGAGELLDSSYCLSETIMPRHLLDNQRRHAFGRLVEQHQVGVAHERARNGQHLLLAAAHLPPGRRIPPRLGNSANSLPASNRRALARRLAADTRFSRTVRSVKMRRSSGTQPRPSRPMR